MSNLPTIKSNYKCVHISIKMDVAEKEGVSTWNKIVIIRNKAKSADYIPNKGK